MKPFLETARELSDKISCFIDVSRNAIPHFHSQIEVWYVAEGSIKASINGCERIVSAGCAAVADSYDVHHYKTQGSSAVIVSIIPVESVPGFRAGGKTFSSPFWENNLKSRELCDAVNKLRESVAQKREQIMRGLSYIILGLLIEEIGLTDAKNKGSQELGRNLLMYIENHCAEDISIADLAAHFGYTRDYISRLLNQRHGIGFNAYLNTLRVRHAAKLLTEGEKGLADIAFETGFGNYRSFNRAFKAHYLVTPNEYRGKARRGR
jgi:AraC-like DNA-binding protein